MLTDRFKIRKNELNQVFSKYNISKTWRDIVRDQLRRTDIIDIFDNYDFNFNIDARALLLRSNLLGGNYQTTRPLIYRIEKKLGICRHLVIPQPIDALILQVITDFIRTEILGNQPSENSFYSQDRHNLRKPHEIHEYGLTWRGLWKKMQRQIYKFKEEKELIIVTDLSNYYDSIFIPELRKIITGYVSNKEVLLDILFRIIENISWLPDYLPYTGRGLPTSGIEGVRLLAHSFLFEFDSILKEKTNNSFTRWMDDIVIGVNTREEAIETLSSASDVLKSRGLALNLKKTNIYNASEAEFHFLINENQYLDTIDFELHKISGIGPISSILFTKFNAHLNKNKEAKYFEKVSKRYITAFAKLKSKRMLSKVATLFNEHPDLRTNLIYYLSDLGYEKRTAQIALAILEELKLYDDISLFAICKLFTDWEIPLNETGDLFIKQFVEKVKTFSARRKEPFDFYCLLWIQTKYSHPEVLLDFVTRYENIWKTHPFLRRQATAIMARLLPFKEEKVKTFLGQQIATSEPQVVSVANSILDFQTIDRLESKVRIYVFPTKKPKYYPLYKFLVLCGFLNSPAVRNDISVQEKISMYISDPYFRKWIEFQYNIK